jgi:type II secretory pathway component PulF
MTNPNKAFSGEFWTLTTTGFCVALVTAIAALLAVPKFDDVFKSLGADLPAITLVVIQAPYIFFLIPAAVLAIAFIWPNKKTSSIAACVFGVTSVLWGAALVALAMYLPIYQLAAFI